MDVGNLDVHQADHAVVGRRGAGGRVSPGDAREQRRHHSESLDCLSGGGNSLSSNFSASIVGAFMYFATLTEIPILQGLISNGMGQGPALALLLAGPAVSLPNLLVIRSVIGTQKTSVFFVLVVIMATSSGLIYGSIL